VVPKDVTVVGAQGDFDIVAWIPACARTTALGEQKKAAQRKR
jgi:hypothetical protein